MDFGKNQILSDLWSLFLFPMNSGNESWVCIEIKSMTFTMFPSILYFCQLVLFIVFIYLLSYSLNYAYFNFQYLLVLLLLSFVYLLTIIMYLIFRYDLFFYFICTNYFLLPIGGRVWNKWYFHSIKNKLKIRTFIPTEQSWYCVFFLYSRFICIFWDPKQEFFSV